MEKTINVLIIEDNEDDADLLERKLKRGGYHARCRRVETQAELQRALEETAWDLILCDYRMPGFSGLTALKVVKERELDIPFIFVSGTIGEDTAVEAMKMGAHDYVMKDNLKRLLPAIERELKEARVRRERRNADNALRESEKKYRNLVDNAMVGVYRTNLKGDILYVNQAMLRMFEFGSPEEMISESILKRYKSPADRGRFLESLQRNGTLVGFEVELVTKTGRTKNVVISATLEGDFLSGMIMDNTERKRAEEELRESERKLKEAQRLGRIGHWEFDVQTQQIRWSDMVFVIYERDPKLGPPTVEEEASYYSPEDVRRLRNCARHTIETGEPYQIDVRLRLPGGRGADVVATGMHITDAGGRVIRLLGTVQDITERKLAEEKIRQSESQFRMVWESSIDGMRLTDEQGTVLTVNDAFCRMVGKTREEMEGKSLSAIYSEEQRDHIHRRHQERFRSGTVKPHFEQELTLWDGRKRWFEVSNSSFELETQRPLLLSILRDITERKRAEVEVQRSRDWLNAILDASRDGIGVEKNEVLVYANEAFAHIFGYEDPRELIGKHASVVLAEPEIRRMMEYGRKRLTGEQVPEVYEFKGKRRDGRYVDLEASLSSASIAGEEHVIATFRDITERKSLQKQLIEAQKMESIGTLAGGIAHDFNNILGIIMGHASILEMVQTTPERLAQSIQAISKATHRGATLVRQLLTFARKAEVELQSVLVNEILNELAKLFEETFPKTIVVSLKLESSLPPVVADPNQLHQVFLNLCVNARDAMLPKGGTLSMSSRLVDGVAVQVKFPRASAIEYVLVDVRDTGTGMDENTKSRIFEPFFTTKQKGKGTGLGLAMVYGIVENHRGFIDVESTLGAGTTFHVYLPVLPREVKPIEFEAQREEEIPGGTETILLVEDEVMLRELAGLVLEGKGYKVLRAVDGEEAFEMYRRHANEIALVVSDLGLPKLTGEELFGKIRELNTVAKVILASGYIEPELKSQLLKAGAKEFIQKPYVQSEILKKIRSVLDAT